MDKALLIRTLEQPTSDLAARLADVLRDQPEFSGKNLMIKMGLSAINFLFLAPEHLMWRAQRDSAEAAVNWLEALIATNRAHAWWLMPVWGLEVTHPVPLASGASLIPFSALPDSEHRRRFEGRPLLEPFPSALSREPPGSVIMLETVIDPLFYDDNSASMLRLDDNIFTLMDDIRRCLSLIGPAALLSSWRWLQFESEDLAKLAPTGTSSSYVEIHPARLLRYGAFDAERAHQLIERYLALQDSDRSRIGLSLDRFERAMRRHAPGDAAIELAIALDSLLGDGNTELTWRVSLRSALILGGSRADRIQIRSVIKALYDVRSQLVHEGKIAQAIKIKKIGKLSVDDLLKQGRIIAARILEAAILRGHLPDWFEEELGA